MLRLPQFDQWKRILEGVHEGRECWVVLRTSLLGSESLESVAICWHHKCHPVSSPIHQPTDGSQEPEAPYRILRSVAVANRTPQQPNRPTVFSLRENLLERF